ncbi:hypothetical protein OIT44_03395 [Weissella ceti]|uniref:Yip1 domain-containing protein n=1 Tax=Weissella ceti TaxID=759620 RepID=A0ABT3E3X3_9LACO|nr:hypothetical protein [Weissella ceti]MCW0953118.1 hypothetical protein [Weissella ceti]QVK12637.1 hypothetical protein KHQ31_03160 [Weissella ceti]
MKQHKKKPIEVKLIEPEVPKYIYNPSKTTNDFMIATFLLLIMMSIPYTNKMLYIIKLNDNHEIILNYLILGIMAILSTSIMPITRSKKITIKEKTKLSFKEIKATHPILFTLLIATMCIQQLIYRSNGILYGISFFMLLMIEWYFLIWITHYIFQSIDYFCKVDIKKQNIIISNTLTILPIIISFIALIVSLLKS